MKIENIGLPHRITIDAKTLQKFNYILYSEYKLEFTAFCHASKSADHKYHIYDIFFPRQDNAATTTECDGSDVVALMQDGADISKLTGHMHSHVNMGVFASTTDKSDILERASECGYNVALILNKKGEIFGHLADYQTGIYIDGLKVEVVYPPEFEQRMMEIVHSADSLKQVQAIMDYGMDAHFEDQFPLTTSEEDELDAIVAERFQTVVYTQPANVGKQTANSTNKYPLGTISKSAEEAAKVFLNDIAEEANVEEIDNDYPEDPNDWFDEEEMSIIYAAMAKSTQSLTDKEFNLLTEYETAYGSYY